MSSKLYVGNLSYGVTEHELEDAFAQCGEVSSVRLITDRDSGRSKGFAFVEMTSPEAAQQCIEQLDGNELQGRGMRISVAREREARSGGRDRGGDRGDRNNRW